MQDALYQINYLAILLSTIVMFVLGGLWFTQIFGKHYDDSLGTIRDKNKRWPAYYYFGPFIGSLVISSTTCLIIYALKVNNAADAIVLGLLLGVGYGVSLSMVLAINPKIIKPLKLGIITGSYHCVSIVICSLIIFLTK